jgi:hypothetical protein
VLVSGRPAGFFFWPGPGRAFYSPDRAGPGLQKARPETARSGFGPARPQAEGYRPGPTRVKKSPGWPAGFLYFFNIFVLGLVYNNFYDFLRVLFFIKKFN